MTLAATVSQMAGGGLLVFAAVTALVWIGKVLAEHFGGFIRSAVGQSAGPPNVVAAGGSTFAGNRPAGLSERDLRSANGLLFSLGGVARRVPDDAQRKAALSMLHDLEGVLTGAAPAPVSVANGGAGERQPGRSPLISES